MIRPLALPIDPLDEFDGRLHVGQSSRLVPVVLDRLAVVGVPAAGAVALADVGPDPEPFGLGDDLVAVRADLDDGGRAGAQQLRHREGDAGAVGGIVGGGRAGREVFEQAGEVELTAAPVLDEALVERRFVQVGVGVDQPRREDFASGIQHLVDRLIETACRADVDDRCRPR